jgi:hypothetical protein
MDFNWLRVLQTRPKTTKFSPPKKQKESKIPKRVELAFALFQSASHET